MLEKIKKFAQRGVVGLGLATMAVASHAALPAGVTAAFTQVSEDGGAMITAGWPVLVAITVGLILMKLFKKVVSKAS